MNQIRHDLKDKNMQLGSNRISWKWQLVKELKKRDKKRTELCHLKRPQRNQCTETSENCTIRNVTDRMI